MASKRNVRRKACLHKKKYENFDEALKAKRYYGNHMGTIPYLCKFCGKWHLGHPPKNVRNSLKKQGRGYLLN